jgi:hypothetical protein
MCPLSKLPSRFAKQPLQVFTLSPVLPGFQNRNPWQILIKLPIIRFPGYVFIGSRVITCGQIFRHAENDKRVFLLKLFVSDAPMEFRNAQYQWRLNVISSLVSRAYSPSSYFENWLRAGIAQSLQRLGYELNDRGIWVRFPTGRRNSVEIGSGVHPTFP